MLNSEGQGLEAPSWDPVTSPPAEECGPECCVFTALLQGGPSLGLGSPGSAVEEGQAGLGDAWGPGRHRLRPGWHSSCSPAPARPCVSWAALGWLGPRKCLGTRQKFWPHTTVDANSWRGVGEFLLRFLLVLFCFVLWRKWRSAWVPAKEWTVPGSGQVPTWPSRWWIPKQSYFSTRSLGLCPSPCSL